VRNTEILETLWNMGVIQKTENLSDEVDLQYAINIPTDIGVTDENIESIKKFFDAYQVTVFPNDGEDAPQLLIDFARKKEANE